MPVTTVKKEGSLVRLSRGFAWAGWILLLLAGVVLATFKAGLHALPPTFLAILFLAALVCLAARLGAVLLASLYGQRRPGSALAEILTVGGLLLAIAAGTANWLFSLQGVVVLQERETARLDASDQLQGFDAGPLARLDEMGYSLRLDELELVPSGTEGFFPSSRLRVWKEAQDAESIEINPREWAEIGALRLHQGAFGFAPRIVILHNEQEVFDQVVPFLTRRQVGTSLSFDGIFTLESESLEVTGMVNLASLDEAMQGHASLELAVTGPGGPLGRGSLLPGHFAALDDGYRIGFAGLHRWSEIDISRRNYGQLVLGGAIVAGLGALFWPIASWRRW
jgi:hypothetical protein